MKEHQNSFQSSCWGVSQYLCGAFMPRPCMKTWDQSRARGYLPYASPNLILSWFPRLWGHAPPDGSCANRGLRCEGREMGRLKLNSSKEFPSLHLHLGGRCYHLRCCCLSEWFQTYQSMDDPSHHFYGKDLPIPILNHIPLTFCPSSTLNVRPCFFCELDSVDWLRLLSENAKLCLWALCINLK